MKELVKHIASYLTEEVARILASPAGREARPIFRGVPSHILEQLLDFLGESNGLIIQNASGERQIIPIFLVASTTNNPEGLNSGKCTDSHLLRIRNNTSCNCFLTLLPPRNAVNESISSSATYLGVEPNLENGQIKDDPFVSLLIEYALGITTWSKEQKEAASRVVQQALIDAANLDIGSEELTNQWNAIERLFEICNSYGVTPRELVASMGLPHCEASEIGSKQHVGVLERVGQELESQGLSNSFDSWITSAPDIKDALVTVQAIIREKCNNGPTFAKSPMSYYRLALEDVIASKLPVWWETLTLARWDELLQSDVPQDNSLMIKPQGALVDSGAGLPIIFQGPCTFTISIDNTEFENITVKVSVSKSTKDFKEIGKVNILKKNGVFIDPSPQDHQSPLRYRFEADGFLPETLRVIALDYYSPGVVVHSRGASKHALFKKSRKTKGVYEYESDLEFPGVGSHHADILHGKEVLISEQIIGHDTSTDLSDPQHKPINKSSNTSASTLIQTDDESVHEFSAVIAGDEVLFRIFVRASDVPPVGVASEFDRLILEHRSGTHRSAEAARVEPSTCRANDLEHWVLQNPNSFNPLVIGEDYLEAWAMPDWKARPVISAQQLQHDPRPDPSSFQPPIGYIQARESVQKAILFDASADEIIEMVAFGDRMRDEVFRKKVELYLDEYNKWLKNDYESAIWADVISVHRLDANGTALNSYPHAILLTPLHPLRFGWQCVAQALLQDAIDHRLRCPAASILDPKSTPDCLVLPCRTPVGKNAQRVFLSVASSSDYWGVLWSGEGDQLRLLEDEAGRSIFDKEFGITIEGLSSGFSVPQVERAIEEISFIWAAKTTLRISVSTDTSGSSSCNEGIASWGRKNLGEQDPWRSGGPRTLEIHDERKDELQPEDAELSTLTQVLNSSIQWYNRPINAPQADLAIIAHLGTQSPELDRQGLSSPIDAVGLNRVRIRRQLAASDGKFIAESRIGKHEAGPETFELLPEVAKTSSAQLANITHAIEGRCSHIFDSYVFMPKRPTLEKAIVSARYCAVSSSNVDPACFFSLSEKSYLWDYDLPSYSRRSGENNGFYLIANESPTIRQAASGAIKDLNKESDIDEATISNLLREISRRGVPTLKKLTGGGTASLGEIGVLTCLRALQCEFADVTWPCIFPVRSEGSPLINLIIPVDPFQAYFDELRQGLHLQDYERPDLLCISLQFDSNQLTAMKVTPVEVKARASGITEVQLRDAIEQARIFGAFLEELGKRSSEHAVWGIAYRHLITAWIDYAFRVYGQLRHLMNSADWSEWHGEVLAAILSGRITPQVDSRGRLFVIGAQKESEKRDLDQDGLNEVLIISHIDAYLILTEPSQNVTERLRNVLGDWQLTAEVQAVKSLNRNSTMSQLAPASDSATDITKQAVSVTIQVETDQQKNVGFEEPQKPSGDGVRFAVGKTVSTIIPHDRYFHPSNTALNQLNIGIVGDLGVGKTQLVQALLYQLRNTPASNRGNSPNIFIFDYKKDYSKKEFIDATKARVVRPEHLPLNLFEIPGFFDSDKSWLLRARCFIDILSRVYAGIGPVQQEKLKNAVRDAYLSANSSNRGNPTIYDVFDSYANIVRDKLDAPYSIMSNMVDMELFTRDQSAILSFSEFFSGPVVVDLGYLQDDDKTKNVVVAILLNLYFSYMLSREKKPFIGTNPQLRYIDSYLLVDEANNIMQYEFDVLKKLLLQGREFGIGVVLASQYLSHFKTTNEDYREPLLTWFVHKVPNLSVKDLVGIGLTDVDQGTVDRVKCLANHHCLYKTLNVPGEIIRATPFYELMNQG